MASRTSSELSVGRASVQKRRARVIATVVGDQQVGARHGQRAHHRVQLIVLDLNAGAERGLQRGGVGRGDRAQCTA